jgi:hypothetical protein
MSGGDRFLLDVGFGLDLGVREIEEVERDFGRSSDDICKEYVARPTLESMAS